MSIDALSLLWALAGVGKIPWRRERLPTLVFWPGEFQGLYSPQGCKESHMTDFHFLPLSWCHLYLERQAEFHASTQDEA